MSYGTQRPLTEGEKIDLARLNDSIKEAIKARTAWLDAKMVETSTLKVGDEIYDVDSGAMLGTVTGLYRYWRDQNDLLDTSYYCEYRYQSAPGYNNNTSSQTGRSFGTRQEAGLRAEMRAAALR
jgi:hypothetical protein